MHTHIHVHSHTQACGCTPSTPPTSPPHTAPCPLSPPPPSALRPEPWAGTRHRWAEHDLGLQLETTFCQLRPLGTSHLVIQPSWQEHARHSTGLCPVLLNILAAGYLVGGHQHAHSPSAQPVPRAYGGSCAPRWPVAAPNSPSAGQGPSLPRWGRRLPAPRGLGTGLTSDWRPGHPGCWRRGGGALSASWWPAALGPAETGPPGCPGYAGRRTRM